MNMHVLHSLGCPIQELTLYKNWLSTRDYCNLTNRIQTSKKRRMKLTLFILTLAVSMAAAKEEMEDIDEEIEINSFIESLLQSAKVQKQTGNIL